MGRFREYKNGIYGVRYNGYYIVPKNKGRSNSEYCVVNAEKQTIVDGMTSVEDCKWEIDIRQASASELKLIKRLYDTEIIDLSILLTQIQEKETRGPLTDDEKVFNKWLRQVRTRKADNKELKEI